MLASLPAFCLNVILKPCLFANFSDPMGRKLQNSSLIVSKGVGVSRLLWGLGGFMVECRIKGSKPIFTGLIP